MLVLPLSTLLKCTTCSTENNFRITIIIVFKNNKDMLTVSNYIVIIVLVDSRREITVFTQYF